MRSPQERERERDRERKGSATSSIRPHLLKVLSQGVSRVVLPKICEAWAKEKVVEFVNDALQIEGLTDRRRREVCSVNASASLSELLEKDWASQALFGIVVAIQG